MSGRSSFGGAFLGGLLGSNRPLQRWVGRWARHILVTVLVLPAVVMTRLGVPPTLAFRATIWLWVGLLVLVLVRKVLPAVGRWLRRGSSWSTHRPDVDRPTWVYWLFDRDGVFLYVGIAYDVQQRMQGHENDDDEQHWWWRVDDSRTVTHRYDTREQAKAVETAYIKGRRELPRPQHNRQENTDPAQGI